MHFTSQTDYWNSVAKSKEFTTNLNYGLIAPFIKQESNIVDYGCGYGRTLNEFHEKGFNNLTGFDYAAEMISSGKKRFPFLNLKVCQDNKMNIPSDSTDLVLLFAVLTCIIDDEKQQELMDEIQRVLKPGGLIYLNDFLLNDDERNLSRYEIGFNKYKTYGVFELPEGVLLRHHAPLRMKELTKNFIPVVDEKTIFKTMNGHTSNGIIFIGRKR
jgi:ubiquinone/menaquinone biosynthesis C-methylase UbiE